MEPLQRKKGGKRRTQVKRPSLHSEIVTPTWLSGLPLPAQIEPTNPPAFQFAPLLPIAPMPQPEKSFGDLLLELLLEAYKAVWKQTDPISYNANQAMFALAPYWPPESRWMLGVGAFGSAVYGLGQVADRLEKAIERETKRG